MSVIVEPTTQPRPLAPPLSPGHGASLSTTAGITSVITGVMAAALAGQVPGEAGALAGALAGGAIASLAVGAAALYEARNGVCAAMDEAPGDPARAAALAARALTTYHLGMAGVFLGFTFAAAWRVALPLGGAAWAGPLAAALATLVAAARAAAWLEVWRQRKEACS